MPYIVMSSIGKDKPGLIAAMSSTVASGGGNIEDLDSVVLKGKVFLLSMAIQVGAEKAEALKRSLIERGKEVGLRVFVYDGADFNLR